MKNKVFYLVALAVGMVFVMSGCKDCDDPSDPDCGNYDPCFGQEEFKPNFDIILGFEEHPEGTEYVPFPIGNGHSRYRFLYGDSTIRSAAYFRAPDDYDSVKWEIGYEDFYRTEKFLLIQFGIRDEVIPIRMYGFRVPNKKCFPNEQPIDTVVRNITLMHPDSSRVFGNWIGAYETEPNDSFEFTIYSPKLTQMKIINFPPNVLNNDKYSYSFLYSSFKGVMKGELSQIDHLNRCFLQNEIEGNIFGNHYQYMEVKMKYRYEIDGKIEKEIRNVKFNARRK
jgi:hypothetical protein